MDHPASRVIGRSHLIQKVGWVIFKGVDGMHRAGWYDSTVGSYRQLDLCLAAWRFLGEL